MRRVEDNRNQKPNACQPLSDLLADFVRNCQGGSSTSARSVWAIWDRVVGEPLAENAQPAAFKERTLVVHVRSSTWLQELHFQKSDLIQRLNQAAGSRVVEEIRFKIGTLPSK